MASLVTQPGYRSGESSATAGLKLPLEVLTLEEARALLRIPSPRAPTGIRNRALLAVLYRGGLRISEALALERRDLDARACTLTVRNGKGDRHRTVGMDPEAFALLTRWLEERKRLGLSRPSVVFCTLDGKPLFASYVRAPMLRLALKAGSSHSSSSSSVTPACTRTRCTCACRVGRDHESAELKAMRLGGKANGPRFIGPQDRVRSALLHHVANPERRSP